MSHDGGTPGWSALTRLSAQLYDAHRSPYADLTDDQLIRSLEAGRRGEPEPPDVEETLRAAIKLMPAPPAWLAAMSDAELLAYLEREADLLRAERRQPQPGED